MARYRQNLPQLGDQVFLTDGGIETTLIFHDGLELPYFAAFPLLDSKSGIETLRSYYRRYVDVARELGLGLVLERPTWRASQDWAARLGYDVDDLARVNRAAIGLMAELRTAHETDRSPMVISGCIGPRGDGYDPGRMMN